MERLDRRVRADRHELGRLDDPVTELQAPEPGAGAPVGRRRDEHLEAGRAHPVISARSTMSAVAAAAMTR